MARVTIRFDDNETAQLDNLELAIRISNDALGSDPNLTYALKTLVRGMDRTGFLTGYWYEREELPSLRVVHVGQYVFLYQSDGVLDSVVTLDTLKKTCVIIDRKIVPTYMTDRYPGLPMRFIESYE